MDRAATRAWRGTRQATRPGNSCVHAAVYWRPGAAASTTEDCLFANVYTPARDRSISSPKLVMVFFHGGGNINGAATDNVPTAMAQQGDAVVVTINYRLGAEGNFYLPALDQQTKDGRSAGNYGNLDKLQALRWVRQNIAAFGGNPSNVTIGGQSAGAGGTCWLMASPAAKGLFARAIVESPGSCASSGVTKSQATKESLKLARAAGCTGTEVLACLEARPAADILTAQVSSGASLNPVVGGPAMPVTTGAAFTSGHFNRVPVIFGDTRNESRSSVYQAYDYKSQPVTPRLYRQAVKDSYGDNAAKVVAQYPIKAYSNNPGLALSAVQTDDWVAGNLSESKIIAHRQPETGPQHRLGAIHGGLAATDPIRLGGQDHHAQWGRIPGGASHQLLELPELIIPACSDPHHGRGFRVSGEL